MGDWKDVVATLVLVAGGIAGLCLVLGQLQSCESSMRAYETRSLERRHAIEREREQTYRACVAQHSPTECTVADKARQ